MKFYSLKWKILIVTLPIFILGAFIFWFGSYRNNMLKITENLKALSSNFPGIFRALVEQEKKTLGATLAGLTTNQEYLRLLSEKDRQALLSRTEIFFTEIKQKYLLTHLYFIEPSGSVLLRNHQPDKYGDILQHHTFLEAKKTGKLATGIEMGELFFSLRAVQAVHYNNVPIGYIEIGQEIDQILSAFKMLTGNDISVFLSQEFTKEKSIKIQSEISGNYSLTMSTDKSLSLSLFPKADTEHPYPKNQIKRVFHNDRYYILNTSPLEDAGGRTIGAIFITQDATFLYENMLKAIIYNTILFVMVFLALLLANALLLRKTVLQPIEIARDVAYRLADGHMDLTIDVKTRDESGQLLVAMQKMLQAIRSKTLENESQNRLKSELARLTILSQGIQNLEALAQFMLSELATGMEVGQGVFYVNLGKKKDGTTTILTLLGSYAFQKRKNMTNSIEAGEGLAGQSALEKKPILLTRVPPDYVEISSGLGEHEPLNIYAQPVLFEDEVMGVIELASFHEFTQFHKELLAQISLNLGIVIKNILGRKRTEELLQESRRLTEKSRVQSEELQQANDELEQKSKILEVQSEKLRAANEELEEKTNVLKKQKANIEKKNAEVEMAKQLIEEKAHELELAGKYKSEFLANMSHELRTPLNSLLILSRMLASNEEGNLVQEQIEYARVIHNSGRDLLKLINDILDLSKVEAGKLNIQIEKTDVQDIVNSVVEQFKPIALDKNLSFDTEIDPGLSSAIQTDKLRTAQILKNLLSNAFKFTQDGSVVLKVYKTSFAKKFRRKQTVGNEAVAFSVQDTGIGIRQEKQEEIFEAFQQADGSTERKYGGTGLGLTISRELTRLLGGRIEMRSREGQGSVFTLLLPFKQKESPQQPGMDHSIENYGNSGYGNNEDLVLFPATHIQDDRGSITEEDAAILLIEDDSFFSKTLLQHIHKRGYKYLYASDGKSGLQLAKRYNISAIILDPGLPDMNGGEVVDSLKADQKTENIPVHVISAADDAETLLEKIESSLSGSKGWNNPATYEPNAKLLGKKILLVDDDLRNTFALSGAIRKYGLKVVIADNGELGLQKLEEEPKFDIVLMDIMMPVMDGYETIRRIRAQMHFKKLPIIAFTAKAMSNVQEKCLELGANDYLTKPVDMTKLMTMVEKWLFEPK